MPGDALEIGQETHVRLLFARFPEHPPGPDHAQGGDGQHQAGRDEKQDARRADRAVTLERLAEQAAADEGDQVRKRHPHRDDAAHLAGDGVLARQRVGHAIDGAGHHAERHGRHEQADEEHRIGRAQQRHRPVDHGVEYAEHQHVGAVASAERAPAIPDVAEHEAQDQGQADPQLEDRQLMRRQVHPVLEEEGDRNVDHPPGRRREVHQDQQQKAERERLRSTATGQGHGWTTYQPRWGDCRAVQARRPRVPKDGVLYTWPVCQPSAETVGLLETTVTTEVDEERSPPRI